MSASYPTLDIAGQVVLITGASAGIGRFVSMECRCPQPTHATSHQSTGAACAWRFAELGCKLVLLARRVDRLHELKAQLQAHHQATVVHVVQLDMQDLNAIKQLIDTLPPELRDINILVNNAGLALVPSLFFCQCKAPIIDHCCIKPCHSHREPQLCTRTICRTLQQCSTPTSWASLR